VSRVLDISVSAVLLAIGVAFMAHTYSGAFDTFTFGGDVGPAFAPRLFLTAWITFAALALIKAIRSGAPEPLNINLTQLLSVAAVLCLTAYAITKVGFVFATIPGLAAFLWAIGYRKPVVVVLISILGPVVIWALFTFGFELLLPRSPWFYQI